MRHRRKCQDDATARPLCHMHCLAVAAFTCHTRASDQTRDTSQSFCILPYLLTNNTHAAKAAFTTFLLQKRRAARLEVGWSLIGDREPNT